MRDDFQYFGTATTDADGSFAFRTMTPGAGVERPAHLHIIAHRNGEPLLITQLYFAEDHGVLLDDYIYRQRGEGYDELLFMQDIAAACYAGEATVGARVVFAQVVLDQGEGALAPTPTQPRGNFYPIVDFRGYDNDLLDADPHQEQLTVNDVPEILSGRVGDGLWFIGKLFNRAGEQLEGYQIQLWQADDHGRHNHPDDDAPIELRDDFQYFGIAHTDGDGFLVFRTLKPFPYRQRPAHLHFIVKQNDEPVLVSQFFFPEDRAYVLRDRIYLARSHGDDELLFMHDVASDCKTGEETDRLRVLMGQIVINQDEGPRLPNPVLAPGPFQPVIDFSDYDNDLLDANPYQERLTVADVPQIMPSRAGNEVWLKGVLTDRAGQPLAGYLIEFWHVDENGRYNHPLDCISGERREDFQYFGAMTTDESGVFVFRTLQPVEYDERRPAHFHVKVKRADQLPLISQLYFPEDSEEVLSERIFLRDGGDESLILEDVNSADATVGLRVVMGPIVLDLGEGPLSPTASQGEGPYYPVVDFSGYDNDLLDANPHQEPLTIADVPGLE